MYNPQNKTLSPATCICRPSYEQHKTSTYQGHCTRQEPRDQSPEKPLEAIMEPPRKIHGEIKRFDAGAKAKLKLYGSQIASHQFTISTSQAKNVELTRTSCKQMDSPDKTDWKIEQSQPETKSKPMLDRAPTNSDKTHENKSQRNQVKPSF